MFRSIVSAVLIFSFASLARGQDDYYWSEEGDDVLLVDSTSIQLGVSIDGSEVSVSASMFGGLVDFGGSFDPFGSMSGWAMMAGDGIFREGGKTATNLTPRVKDTEGDKPGLSVTTTPPPKGWKLPDKKKLDELGFEIEADPTEKDPNHHVIRPGKKLIDQGLTLEDWAKGRDKIDEKDPDTWPKLTKILHELSEPVPAK